MANSPRLGLRRPQGSDNFTPSADLTNHADILDDAAIYQAGTLAARPTAGEVPAGTIYPASDAGVTYMSDGVNWIVVGVRPVGDIGTTELADGAVTAAKLADAAKLGLSEPGLVRGGKCVIATEESRTNTAFGKLATPDQVSGVTLAEDGLIFISYRALWKGGMGYAGNPRAAIFLGANQLEIPTGVVAAGYAKQEAVHNNELLYELMYSNSIGLVSSGSSAYSPALVTTGMPVGARGAAEYEGATGYTTQSGSLLVVEAAAGSYDISVQFRSKDIGTVTVKNRKLRVWTKAF